MSHLRMRSVIGTFVAGGLAVAASMAMTACSDDVGQLRQLAVSTPTTGAIFTTLEDGSAVNANIYLAKQDVYLDGGPGPKAPIDAAGLPAGDYFFQVTDPSGKTLLSTDHINCRRVTVSEDGIITAVVPGTGYKSQGKTWVEQSCQHETGTDLDHAALTVQLYPYDDTPNRGGVYKAWMTPVGEYLCADYVPEGKKASAAGEDCAPFHGFVPRYSKTDNFKVREKKHDDDPPPTILVRKFHDANHDGAWTAGESEIEGWGVTVTDPIAATNQHHTPATVIAGPGTWSLEEALPVGVRQTVAFLDGAIDSMWPAASPTVMVDVKGAPAETHEVIYGNVALGAVTACKVYDRNANGLSDEGEPPVAGWPMTLAGELLDEVRMQRTGPDGCTTFADLLPGDYTLSEGVVGGSWEATGDVTRAVVISSVLEGSALLGTLETRTFTNVCTMTADFGTKGYWHNKNGMAEITGDDLAAVNNMPPYKTPSSYFDAGDEPFDGFFDDKTTEVAAVLDAPAGSPLAEVSLFLVDANATGDPREQLAQQLLAFVMNTRHRLDGGDPWIKTGTGYLAAGDLIDEAVSAWSGMDAAKQNAVKDQLDALNNMDALPYVPATPCPIPD